MRRVGRKAGSAAAKEAIDKRARILRQKWSQENRARGIAFLIARAIKRRGLPAKHILERAKPAIISQVIQDIDTMLAKGVE